MKTVKIECTLEMHDNYSAFSEEEVKLFQLAKSACDKAYAPYSNFRVGAAVVLEDGQIFQGNNQENAAYPSGLCAERVALFYAMSMHPNKKATAIAITVDYKSHPQFQDVVAPCGGCRQVIAEYEHKFNNDIKIYLLGREEKVCIVPSMKAMLPLVFTGDMLHAMHQE